MKIAHSIAELRDALGAAAYTAFVPTMGNLHDGHLALVAQARQLAAPRRGQTVASIFVNRLQFGINEDFDRYPRTFARDCDLLQQAGCDLLFAPDETVMYPVTQSFVVTPDPALTTILEGAVRPGHFAGVCTVVLKLFAMVRPDVAVFGMKDYQQLMVIRHMVEQFSLALQIVGYPTVRESDGLAMSSRNGFLTAPQRAQAGQLNRALVSLVETVRRERKNGLANAALESLESQACDHLRSLGWQPDYLTVRRRRDLASPDAAELAGDEPLVALGAARLGTPRLLDNIEI